MAVKIQVGPALSHHWCFRLTLNYRKLCLPQRRWRAKVARKKLIEAVRLVYQKYRDPESGCYYYYDVRTGETSWVKPKLLGTKDLHETFVFTPRVPEPAAVAVATPPAVEAEGEGVEAAVSAVSDAADADAAGVLDAGIVPEHKTEEE